MAGLRASVEAAEALIQNVGHVAVRRLNLTPEEAALINGRARSTIRELQESKGCSLEIRDQRSKGSNELIIAGGAVRVCAAACSCSLELCLLLVIV